MNNSVLTPGLCSRIVQLASHRDLKSLCLTSKSFAAAAQSRLYTTLHLNNAPLAYQVCLVLISSPRNLASHVKHFLFYHTQRSVLPEAFWLVIAGALQKMHRLESLVILDPAEGVENNSWVLEGIRSEGIKELKLRLGWDKFVREFIERQPRLKFFHCVDRAEDVFHLVPGPPVPPGTLGCLHMLDAAMVVVAELLETVAIPITHLQVHIDMEFGGQVLEFIPLLAKIKDTLRSLSVIDVPEEVVGKTLKLIAMYCPELKHLGIVPLPCQNVRLDFRLVELRPNTFYSDINFIDHWYHYLYTPSNYQ
jgi:hypothetical protein